MIEEWVISRASTHLAIGADEILGGGVVEQLWKGEGLRRGNAKNAKNAGGRWAGEL